jgi:hypothetical protein
MSPYEVALPVERGYVSPFAKGQEKEFIVRAVNDVIDAAAGTRSLTLEIVHPEVIWSGACFFFPGAIKTLSGARSDRFRRARPPVVAR